MTTHLLSIRVSPNIRTALLFAAAFTFGAAATSATAGRTQVRPSHTGVEKLWPATRLTCPSVPAGLTASLQRLTCPRQHPFGSGQRPGIRPVMRDGRRRAGHLSRFPVALRRTGIRFLGILFPPRDSASLTVGLPAPSAGPDGFSTFRMCEQRPGWAPPRPRGQRCSHDRRKLSGRRLPFLHGQALHPGAHPTCRGSG